MNENIEELDEEKDIGPEAVNLINKLKRICYVKQKYSHGLVLKVIQDYTFYSHTFLASANL